MTTPTVAAKTYGAALCLRDWYVLFRPGAHNTFPYHLGPICEACWVRDGYVTAVGVAGCDHE